jgi:hypothetical protein
MMPFRFRKILSFGKGFRLNLSKGGISSSIGKPGATLNFGKRGVRPTVGLPGTGLSFTGSPLTGGSGKNNASINALTSVIIAVIVLCLSAACCAIYIFGGSDTSSVATPTSTPAPVLSLEQIIAFTAEAAKVQTQAAYSPTPPPLYTETFTPTVTMMPTATLSDTEIQTVQAIETYNASLLFTVTPFATSDSKFIVIPPSDGGTCSCSGDTMNCSDFSSHTKAQACFDWCISQGAGDIHKLDQNNDGNACESLP